MTNLDTLFKNADTDGVSPDVLPMPLTEQEAEKIATHRHYKGGLYRVLGEALHTETQEIMVVYSHVWPHEPCLYVRPKTMFYENLPDSTPRFRKL